MSVGGGCLSTFRRALFNLWIVELEPGPVPSFYRQPRHTARSVVLATAPHQTSRRQSQNSVVSLPALRITEPPTPLAARLEMAANRAVRHAVRRRPSLGG